MPKNSSPAPVPAGLEEARDAIQSILIRCREGDKGSNWLPIIDGLAVKALAALAAPGAPQGGATQTETATRNVLETYCDSLGLRKGMPLWDLAHCVTERLAMAATPPKGETPSEAARLMKIGNLLDAVRLLVTDDYRAQWKNLMNRADAFAEALRNGCWPTAEGVTAPGTPIEKGLEELHLTGKDVARMRHAVECWDEFHKREDSRPGSSWALAPLEIAEEQFRLLVADARASLSSLPQEGAAGEGGAG